MKHTIESQFEYEFKNDPMRNWVEKFPFQLKHALDIPLQGLKPTSQTKNLFLCGMGGSAIGGELLLEALYGRFSVPVQIIREAKLPFDVDEHSCVVLCSYSGNTNEVIDLISLSESRNACIGVVSSGGKLLTWAESKNVLSIQLPSGYSPRAALGYLFTGIWKICYEFSLLPNPYPIVSEASETLCGVIDSFTHENENDKNSLLDIVSIIHNKIPWIWTSSTLSSVGRRWANQFAENSKQLSHFGVLPEVLHNEIVSICDDPSNQNVIQPILLIDNETTAVKATIEILRESSYQPLIIKRREKDLAGLLYLVLLGDFLSVELAKKRKLLPTPIPSIDKLKQRSLRS